MSDDLERVNAIELHLYAHFGLLLLEERDEIFISLLLVDELTASLDYSSVAADDCCFLGF